jgi:hypothetical protein
MRMTWVRKALIIDISAIAAEQNGDGSIRKALIISISLGLS